MKKVMILVIDGCAPAYLTRQTAPNIYRLARETGFAKTVECAMPSVTNVNHACILSGRWPAETQIAGNYYYDPETRAEGFIEERGRMQAETLLQRYAALGGKTALLTVKGKVLGVYGDGASVGLSAQTPDDVLMRRYKLAPPPAIDSVESTEWILSAACACIREDDPDLLYCTTNDYIFHHFAPGTPEAAAQIAAADSYIAQIHALAPDRQIYITADHGMNQKTTILNFGLLADAAGFDVYCLPPLKDRYIENHIYQEGGMLYVYLRNPAQAEAFRAFAAGIPQIERVLTAEEASGAYRLPETQIGDFVLFAGRDSAFGEAETAVLHTEASRTHGSLYEREIPLIALNPEAPAGAYAYNKDVAALLFESLA